MDTEKQTPIILTLGWPPSSSYHTIMLIITRSSLTPSVFISSQHYHHDLPHYKFISSREIKWGGVEIINAMLPRKWQKRESCHMTPARLVKGWSEKLENFTVTNWEQFEACALYLWVMELLSFWKHFTGNWEIGCYLELKSPDKSSKILFLLPCFSRCVNKCCRPLRPPLTGQRLSL